MARVLQIINVLETPHWESHRIALSPPRASAVGRGRTATLDKRAGVPGTIVARVEDAPRRLPIYVPVTVTAAPAVPALMESAADSLPRVHLDPGL